MTFQLLYNGFWRVQRFLAARPGIFMPFVIGGFILIMVLVMKSALIPKEVSNASDDIAERCYRFHADEFQQRLDVCVGRDKGYAVTQWIWASCQRQTAVLVCGAKR